MSSEKKLKEIKKERRCRRCGNNKGLIRKYNLMLCFRCFKEIAEKMGFKKYD